MDTTQAPIGALKIREAAKYVAGVSQITVRRLIKRTGRESDKALD